ncbi:MAG TPA: hypothetical protein VMI53_04570 [Opitutaceae bacterium]|nr:hypothetical protein [Opitutaceae bacterium]
MGEFFHFAFFPFIPLLIVPLIAGLVIWATLVQKQRTAANLQKLAVRLGLEFLPAGGWLGRPSIVGPMRGKAVQIFNYTTGSGKSRTTWSAMKAQLAAPSQLSFTLRKQGFATRIIELFGAHEITVGDAEFDKAWFVQTNQPGFMRAALIPEMRAKLMAALHAGLPGAFELNGRDVKYAEVGTFADAKRIERFAALGEVLCDLADVAEVAADQGKP